MTMDGRKALVARLAGQFKENEAYCLSKDFVESEARSKFIDPLLEALGWDVKNEKGARHDKREVITEDRVVIDGQTKHPDYTLCYGGERKMYVEAKQPSVNLKDDPEPALQLAAFSGSDADRSLLEQRVSLIDSQINALVYKLYGLTAEEIAVVEGK